MQCFELILSTLLRQFFNAVKLSSKETSRISSPTNPKFPFQVTTPNFTESSYTRGDGRPVNTNSPFFFLWFFRFRLYHKRRNPVGCLRGLFISSKCPAHAKARNLGNTHPDHRPFPTLLEVRTVSWCVHLKNPLRPCLNCKLV